MRRIFRWFGYILAGMSALVLVVPALGLFGIPLAIVAITLIFTSPSFRLWLTSQRGYVHRLSKLPGMKSESPITQSIAVFLYIVPISLFCGFVVATGLATTPVLAIILSVSGIVALYGQFVLGWGTEAVETDPEAPKFSINQSIEFLKQNKVVAGIVAIAALLPFACGGFGASMVNNLPEPTAVVETQETTEEETAELSLRGASEIDLSETADEGEEDADAESDEGVVSFVAETKEEATEEPTEEPTETVTPTDTTIPTNTNTPRPAPTNTKEPTATMMPQVEISVSSANLRGGPRRQLPCSWNSPRGTDLFCCCFKSSWRLV